MSDATERPEQRVTIDGVDIDLVRIGDGRPLLYLHSVDGIHHDAPYFRDLADHFHVVAPWHPGFGHSALPREFRTVGDLAFFYLQLIDELAIHDAVLVGTSFGGWLAAEIAIRTCAPFTHLVLLDPLGIKVGDRETRDIADVYAMSQDEMTERTYHDPGLRTRDYSTMSDDDLLAIARSREAYTYFGWRPYMHNPTLRRWLRRISLPTLVLWGESDRFVHPDYGRAYAAEIPDARFELVPEAGHYPHIEQPAHVLEAIQDFVGQPHRTASRPATAQS